MKNIIRFTILCLVIIASTSVSASQSSALSGSDFQAGRIIDDSIFFNGNDFSAQQVQNFLNAKVPVCDTNHASGYGQNPPFICLKDYSQNTPSMPAESGLCSNYSGGYKSAAQIISDVSLSCGINPKVMLVLLQKEQILITDTWPLNSQYTKATGFGCPDSALPNNVDSNQNGCYDAYEGFFNQIYYGARQYKKYVRDATSFTYRAYRNNYVQYNPNAGCGGTNLYIQNQATAGLYNYTPYQPNSAALNNLYGTGDSCSAYGNRNFWRMYSDWFGNSLYSSFSARYVKQSNYPIIDSGNTHKASISFKNTGVMFWKDDVSTFPGYRPIRLATTNTINRASNFADNSWINPARPTGTFAKVYEEDGVTLASDQHTVYPGQIAQFDFTLNANSYLRKGIYREYFEPVLEGAANPDWSLGVYGVFLDVGVHDPSYSAAYASQGPYQSIQKNTPTMQFVIYKNTGIDQWFDDVSKPQGKSPIHLSTAGPINRNSSFYYNWYSQSRPAVNFSAVYNADGVTLSSNQHVVYPGQYAKFEYAINAPNSLNTGTYREYYAPIAEGSTFWYLGDGSVSWQQINVLN